MDGDRRREIVERLSQSAGARREPLAPSGARGRWRRAWRYAAAWVGVWLAGLGLGHALEVGRELAPEALDYRVWRWVVDQREAHPWATAVLRAASRAGDADVGTVVVAALALGLGWYGSRRSGRGWGDCLVFALVVVGSQLLTVTLKLHFGRARPEEIYRLVMEDSSSFPSGHALGSSACCVALAGLVAKSRWPGWWRWALGASLVGLAVVVGASRVWLAVHYLSDVLSGLGLGSCWAALAIAIHRGWAPGSRQKERG